MAKQKIKVVKEVSFNDEALVSNAHNRATIVEQITNGTSFAGMQKAVSLLKRLMRKAASRGLELEVAKIADEIACIIVCDSSVQWVSHPFKLSEALPYLEAANRIEKRFSHLKALVGVRKTLIGTLEIQLANRRNEHGDKRRGQRLKREGVKAMQNCDISQINLARFQALLGCIQWCNDNTEAGDAAGAANHLVKGGSDFEPTAANIVGNKMRVITW